jgi:hypothetical protein
VRGGVASRLQAQIARRECALRRSAHPALGQFITDCRRAIDRARAGFSAIQVPTGRVFSETQRPEVEIVTNSERIAVTVKACEAAIRKAEALKLTDLTDSEIEAQLHALVATLPADPQRPPLQLLDE